MAKIAASLSEAIPDEAALLARLPEAGRSAIIKAALRLYFQVQDGDLLTMTPNERDSLCSGANAELSQSAPAATSADSQLAQVIANNTQAIQVLTALLANGITALPSVSLPDALPATETEEEREALDDPLVQAMMGINFEF